MERHRNSIEYEVWGRYALFSEVATRVGGEKCSYQVPTYQALKGITESIYWKPTFKWVIDAVRVMNKIQTESKGVRTIVYQPKKKNVKNDLSYYTYLKDVRYQVLAHFEWNDQRKELAGDRDENKHHNIAMRCAKEAVAIFSWVLGNAKLISNHVNSAGEKGSTTLTENGTWDICFMDSRIRMRILTII